MSRGWYYKGIYADEPPYLSPDQVLYNSLLNQNYTLAKQLIDIGARLNVHDMKYVNHGTKWYNEYMCARKQCAKASLIITSLRKPQMDPNLFKLLGKYVWSCRDRAVCKKGTIERITDLLGVFFCLFFCRWLSTTRGLLLGFFQLAYPIRFFGNMYLVMG